jgi:hypothetical protein
VSYLVTNAGTSAVIDEKRLAAFMLEHCGGGYTVAQTAKAMETMESIRKGTPYVLASGLKIEVQA